MNKRHQHWDELPAPSSSRTIENRNIFSAGKLLVSGVAVIGR